MDINIIITTMMVLSLTLLSGFGDSQGFIHASNIWKNDSLVLGEFIKSALGFGVGIVTYWFVVKYLQQMGIISPEIQTIGWFAVTIVGVSLASGSFFKWAWFDQLIAILVLFGISWLLVRTGA